MRAFLLPLLPIASLNVGTARAECIGGTSWGSSCASGDADYEVSEGALGDFLSPVPVTCSTAGALTWSFTPIAGDAY